MSEDRYTDWLDDYVDGALNDSDRRLLEAHLDACESCRSLVADLGRIKQEAQALPRRRPPEDVWRQISLSLRTQAGAPPARFWTFSTRWAVAATVLLVIGSVGLLTKWKFFSVQTPSEDPAQLATWVASELQLAEKHYENAIAGLEQIVEKEREEETLDPEVMAVLTENLNLIEQAIGESRAAASQDPSSVVARESLLEALRSKLSLLQNTIMIINEVRKGHGQGAYDRLNEMREGPSSSNPI